MGSITHQENPAFGDPLPFVVKGGEEMAHHFSYLPFMNIAQPFEKGPEILMEIHLHPISKHSADTDGEPFSFWKDPPIAIGNSTEI
jgi:hypothetical protein